ncbi:MAG: metallophosphoesterase [Collinsella sp.]
MHIYAMSDIHGCLDAFKASLSTIDLDTEDSRWSCWATTATEVPIRLVFELVMDLQKRYGDRVVALRGNHEEMFLEYIDEVNDLNFTQAWILADSNLATAKSFLNAEAFKHVKHLLRLREFEEAYAFTVERIKAEHADIIAWVRNSLLLREPLGQVFVHAGIDEGAGSISSARLPSRLP